MLQMASSVNAKITEWVEAVTDLRDTLEADYDDTSDRNEMPECCKATLGERDFRFKQRVRFRDVDDTHDIHEFLSLYYHNFYVCFSFAAHCKYSSGCLHFESLANVYHVLSPHSTGFLIS